MNKREITVFCPWNDGEAAQICRIAEGYGMDIRISKQSWGARLDREPMENLQNLGQVVVVVEMPSLEIEEELRRQGHEVVVIDHHNYLSWNLDRRNELSSLEQFAALIGHKLSRWERGVAINDRAYIYGLIDAGYDMTEIRGIRMADLEAQGATRNDFVLCVEALDRAEVKNGITVVRVATKKFTYINDLCTLGNPNVVQDVLILAPDEIGFSGSPEKAEALSALGGWFGGGEVSKFWGSDQPISDKVFAILGIS